MTPFGSHSAPLTPEDLVAFATPGPGDPPVRDFALAYDLSSAEAGDAIDGLLMRVWTQTRNTGARRHAMLAFRCCESG